jgi:hypothetical protein
MTLYLVILLYGLLFSTSVKAYLHVRNQTHPIGQKGAPPYGGLAPLVCSSDVADGRVLLGTRRTVDDAAIRFDAPRFLNAERT